MLPRRAIAVLTLALLARAAGGVELDRDRPPAQARPDEETAREALERAEIAARRRHDEALRACTRTAQPGACVRDAQEAHAQAMQGLAGARARLATPPPPGPLEAPRTQGETLIRELEQARPQPRPAPSPVPDRPGMGRPFGR